MNPDLIEESMEEYLKKCDDNGTHLRDKLKTSDNKYKMKFTLTYEGQDEAF